MIVDGTIPETVGDSLPVVSYRTNNYTDSFGIVDSTWIINVWASTARGANALAAGLIGVLRDAQQTVTYDGTQYAIKTEASGLPQIGEEGAVNSPVEVRVIYLGG